MRKNILKGTQRHVNNNVQSLFGGQFEQINYLKFMRSSQNMNRIFDGIKELLSFILKDDDGTRVVFLKYSLYLCFRDTTKFFMDDIMDHFPSCRIGRK